MDAQVVKEFFEQRGRRLSVDARLFLDGIAFPAFSTVGVAAMEVRGAFVAYKPLGDEIHVMRLYDLHEQGDALVLDCIFDELDMQVVLKAAPGDEEVDAFFKKWTENYDWDALEVSFNQDLEETEQSWEPPSSDWKPRVHKILELGVRDKERVLQSAGALAIDLEAKDAAYVCLEPYITTFTHHQERIQKVKESCREKPTEPVMEGWIDYLVNSGGQGDFSYSLPEDVAAPNPTLAAARWLLRTKQETPHVRQLWRTSVDQA